MRGSRPADKLCTSRCFVLWMVDGMGGPARPDGCKRLRLDVAAQASGTSHSELPTLRRRAPRAVAAAVSPLLSST